MKYNKSLAVAALLGEISAVKISQEEYPQPDIRGPMPKNPHDDSTFSSFIHNDWTYAQVDQKLNGKEYP